MAFVKGSSDGSKHAQNYGQLYRYGAKMQTQFQCGWDASYLKARPTKPLSFARFGHQAPMPSGFMTKPEFQPLSNMGQRDRPQLPSQAGESTANLASHSSDQAARYFMAGRAGCPFVTKAHEQHVLQSKAVTELNCLHPEIKNHPVCQMNFKLKRGATPMYYKQTGPDAYEFVHGGYTEDFSFMK